MSDQKLIGVYGSVFNKKATCRMTWCNEGMYTNIVWDWNVTPNWFHRLMLRLFFGFKFEILEGKDDVQTD